MCTQPVASATGVMMIDPMMSCAVTFEGPACQLWLAVGADDHGAMVLGAPAEGRRGRADDRQAHCD